MLLSLILAALAAVAVVGSTTGVIIVSKREAQASDERVASLELQTQQLRSLAGPRGINHETFRKTIDGKAKLPVQIWYAPEVPDAFWLMNQLSIALIEAGWPLVGPPAPIPPDKDLPPHDPHVPRFVVIGAQPSGVSVVAHGDPQDIDKPHPEMSGLEIAIAESLVPPQGAHGAFSPFVPFGTLRVIIGPKPDPILSPDRPNP